ncbi:DUF3826 domain-containing protein [Bacteroidota bacterium]
MKIKFIFLLLLIPVITAISQDKQSMEDLDAEYTQVLIDRVNKFLFEIVDTTDSEKYLIVRDIIIRQYKDLNTLDEKRNANVAAIKAIDSLDKETKNKMIDIIKLEAKEDVYTLHAEYIGRLNTELTLEQVDEVKNGMTYNVFPNTYQVYLEMLPDLTEEQKKYIYGCLYAARELAMDKGSSRKKHNTFGKYKGRINNYLSKAGYDLKQAEKEMLEKKKN